MVKLRIVYSANPHQTLEWEEACLKTRRNLKSRERRLRQFRIKNDDCVLDLGCGDGLNISILRQMDVDKVVGIDISKELLELAKQTNPGTKFYVGSAQKIPFKAESFDVVLVDSVFHHLMEYEDTAREIKRVLKRGGRLCFIEPHKSLLRSALDFVSILPGSQYLPFLGNRVVAYRQEIDLMTHWLKTENEFLKALERHGFKKKFCREDFLSIIACYNKL